MQKIISIAKPYKKKNIFSYINLFIYKIGEILEIIIILSLWLYIFKNQTVLSSFTREEIITYLIFGNIIGIITGLLLKRILKHELISKNSKLIIQNPFKYIGTVFIKSFGINFLPFLAALIFDIILLYIFSGSFIINLDPLYLSIIVLMIALAFITELFFIYLVNLYVFWTIKSKNLYTILLRIKKFLAGSYLPLNMLSPTFLFASYMMPFAYSFFVPTQLYLKKIDITTGLKGILIQILWIIILYSLIQISWYKKQKSDLH